MKIALVKQSVYKDLYNCPAGSDPRTISRSSNQRSGPLALLSEFSTQFFIVPSETGDIETQLWRQKVSDCQHGDMQRYWDRANQKYHRPDGSQSSQEELSVPVESVRWNEFDVVISYDIAIPARITLEFPDTLWAYYISEPCMGAYNASQVRPILGYDVFLNQKFREDELLSKSARGQHELEFPYFIQHVDSFHRLGFVPRGARSGVVLDPSAKPLLSDSQTAQIEKAGPVRRVEGSSPNVIQNLMDSKYYLRFGDRAVWGNSSIEAVGSGCLFLTTATGFKNRSFLWNQNKIGAGAHCDEHVQEALRKIDTFESNQDLFENHLAEQQARCRHLCFERPMGELEAALNRKRATS